MKVLIVDDIETNRKLLRVNLEAEGIETCEAADGIEALTALQHGKVDAIISDILMPRMDGYQLCQKVRKDERFGDLPFIFYTSTYTLPGDEKLGMNCGADRYLKRPTPVGLIMRAIRELMDPQWRRPKSATMAGESLVMREYNEVLVRKLEERNQRLELAHEEIALANQELERRVEERTAELVILNQELEAFSHSMEKTNSEILQMTLELESRVDERTAELRISNERLQVENAVRARTERALQQANAYNRSLIEVNLDPLVIMGPDGKITDMNVATETTTGRSRTELIGTDFSDLFTEAGKARMCYEQVFREGLMHDYPLDLRCRDGQVISVVYNASVYRDESGNVIGVFAARDVTERKRFEQSLQEKNVKLEKADLAKDNFLAGMSHELRTPLNAIIGFTGTLLMGLPGPLTPDQKRQLEIIKASGKFQLSLINDLLDLAKIESGKVELNFEPVACRELLGEIAQTLRPLAESKGLNFDLQLDDSEVVLRSDRRALSQILINLINNAIKFTDKGAVGLYLRKTDDAVDIDVTDTGIGIKLEDQKKVFEAFERSKDRARQGKEGTGLGLHLSQKLAALLGGRIQFESEHGKGSKFSLVVPHAD